LTLFLPATSFCEKNNDDRKDKGHNKYVKVDKEKNAYFNEEVKEKVDKILKGALKSIKEPKRSKTEKEPIPDRYLDPYDEETEYDYDYSQVFKGDEDDPDLQFEDKAANKIIKFIEKNEKLRNKDWGWYWDKINKKYRNKKHGKWDIYPILKKLAWKYYRLALEQHEQANYEKAKKYLYISLWFWPTFVEAHTQLGIENLALDNIDHAEINLKRAIKIDPQFGKAYYILSILYLKLEPVQLFNSVEACEYSKELQYVPDPEFYEFLMLIAQLPLETSTDVPPGDEEVPGDEEQPGEEDDEGKPGHGHGDDDGHTGPPGKGKK
jgi:tetratricopeptide (TPR) repeat protein